MELTERCLQLCNYITDLTGVHTTLLNSLSREFRRPPFRTECGLMQDGCDAMLTHLYGAYEAERWEGKYIYYCPRGFAFIATSLMYADAQSGLCIVTGPVVLTNDEEEPFEDCAVDAGAADTVPRLTTKQTHALCELIAGVVASFGGRGHTRTADAAAQMQLLQRMYDVTTEQRIYPIEQEHSLQEAIRAGEKEQAQECLKDILVKLYHWTGSDRNRIYLSVRELLVLMSRAAIDGGADVDEMLSLCYRFEQEIDSIENMEELNRWIAMTLHKFVGFVFDFNDIKHRNVIFQTTAYIKAHLAEKLSLEQAAEQVYLSKSYFCRVLKEELGVTFTEYVNQLRIERSEQLLRDTNRSVAEIALAVGYDDQSYFTRMFKKQTGSTPRRFRGAVGAPPQTPQAF